MTTPTPRPGAAPVPPRQAAPRKRAAPKPPPVPGGTMYRGAQDEGYALGGRPSVENSDRPGFGVKIKSVLDLGMSFLGTPYKWGGASPQTGFDCSGLLQYIYGKAGVSLPRVSRDQARVGRAVAPEEAQPGDLIAFDNSPARPGVDHIGIYLGNGKMLQAPRTGKNVEVVNANLGRAVTIRRVAPRADYSGLPANNNGKITYPAKTTPGGTKPTTISPATGGGDDFAGTTGFSDPNAGILGAGGKIDSQKAIEVYGSVAALAASVPDVAATIKKAISLGIDPNDPAGRQRFQAMLENTAWWKKTSDNQRKNELLKKTNPGEYKRQRQQTVDYLTIEARNLGITVNPQRIFLTAERAMSLGWSQQEMKRYLAADIRVKDAGNSGQVAVTVDALKAQAAEYLVPMSTQTLQTWTQQILKGDVPAEAFTSYLKEQAKSLFPGLKAAIDSGVTVEQYTNPYRQLAAETLEVNPAEVNFLDPKWSSALFQQGKDGTRTSMSLADWQIELRKRPEFRKTRGAQEQAARLTEFLTSTLGATSG